MVQEPIEAPWWRSPGTLLGASALIGIAAIAVLGLRLGTATDAAETPKGWLRYCNTHTKWQVDVPADWKLTFEHIGQAHFEPTGEPPDGRKRFFSLDFFLQDASYETFLKQERELGASSRKHGLPPPFEEGRFGERRYIHGRLLPYWPEGYLIEWPETNGAMGVHLKWSDGRKFSDEKTSPYSRQLADARIVASTLRPLKGPCTFPTDRSP